MLNTVRNVQGASPIRGERMGAAMEGMPPSAYQSVGEDHDKRRSEPVVLVVRAETLLGLGLSSACGERIGGMRVVCVDLGEMIAGRTRTMNICVVLIDASGNEGDVTALVRIARDLHGSVPIALAVGDERHCSFEVLSLAGRGEIMAVIGASTSRDMSGHVLQFVSNGGRYLPDGRGAEESEPAEREPATGASIMLPELDPLKTPPAIEAGTPERLASPPAPARAPVPRKAKPTGALTPREYEVVQLVSDGLQNKLIAHELGLSEHTVKVHLQHAFRKLNAKNRTQAASAFNSLYR